MKRSSLFSVSAIATSSLITLSSVAFAISQPQNITANLELQPSQTSQHSTQKLAGRSCPVPSSFFCGWWSVVDDWFS
ncbi:hypothetical protein VB774_09520 [Pseudanabaena galeata UHCC 0370]|uniref:Uncharacterized protein n=1 Tax=Pseudanabaena galeata UHCC 0370 TaxID=3110310 RepID=A0ABU5TI98_9CYAN|nr:hypothetical protein [Pseudanabaena galeata]MEA5477859.1 hypothetical protein [Pseudanabaena galeata UHCC 0370]